jgi:hypothetical protein
VLTRTGATIIIVMILLALHTMRRRGLTLSEAFQLGRYRITRRGPPPPPPKKAGGWESKRGYNDNYGSMRNTITEPQRAMSINRSGSTSSQRPLMALQRSESFRNGAEPETTQQTFLLDAPPRRNKSNKPHAFKTIGCNRHSQFVKQKKCRIGNPERHRDGKCKEYSRPITERRFWSSVLPSRRCCACSCS